jgi:hypothetical protein
MKSGLLNNRDFLGGLLLIAFGALAVFVAGDYPMGTTMRMGPGYFPTVLGAILLLFGGFILIRGMRSGARVRGAWGAKPLVLVTLSIVLFGFIVERLGMIPALVTLFFVCAAGGHEFRFKEVLLLSVLMTAFTAVVFLYGLRLPYPLLPGIWWIP